MKLTAVTPIKTTTTEKFEFEKAQRNQSKYLSKGRREEPQATTESEKAS
jgi:hypothetical protein